MTVTTTEFLSSVKSAVTVPANQVRFSNANLLSFADEETQSAILPALLSIRQEYLVKKSLVPVEANVSEYKIPYRAVGRNLRDIKLENLDGSIVRTLGYVSPEYTQDYQFLGGDPMNFTVRGEYIVLLPTPTTATFNIAMYYELAPSKLVETSEAGVIQAIDTTLGTVTLEGAISGFTTGLEMDIIDGRTGNSVLAESIANTNVASNVVTFDPDDIPSRATVGDYLALANETPVVQLPTELIQSLVQAVVCRILEAQGDFEGLRAAEAKLEKKLDAALLLLNPRVQSKTPVLAPRNGLLNRGYLRNRLFR